MVKHQQDLFAEEEAPKGMFPYFIEDEDERVEAQAKFIIERHRIYLKKAAGHSAPWTDDPILQNFMFTNVYRELDRVTVWMDKHIMQPYMDHPDLPFMMAIARVINWPDTLKELMDEGAWPEKRWNANKFFNVMKAIQDRGDKVVTGAYIVSAGRPKGAESPTSNKKPYGIAYWILDQLWNNKEQFQLMSKTKTGGSMGRAVEALQQHHGFGPFIANQVVVDLTYLDPWLKKAEDYNTFTSPGPGTIKGMNWMISGKMNGGIPGNKLNKHMIKFRELVNKEVRRQVPAKYWTGNMKTGFEDISMSNYSNCNCETSKMVRSLKDGGANMKNKYRGGT
jgi:hypothetical protein